MKQENKKPRKQKEKDFKTLKQRTAHEQERRKLLTKKKEELKILDIMVAEGTAKDQDGEYSYINLTLIPEVIKLNLAHVYYDIYNNPSEIREALESKGQLKQDKQVTEAAIAEFINKIKTQVVEHGGNFFWEHRQALTEILIDILHYVIETYGVAKVFTQPTEQLKSGDLVTFNDSFLGEKRQTNEQFINNLIKKITNDLQHSLKSLFRKNLLGRKPKFKTREDLELALNSALEIRYKSCKHPKEISQKNIADDLSVLPKMLQRRVQRLCGINWDKYVENWFNKNCIQKVVSGQND